MSSVERGLGGLWSCIYCEGTWLHVEQMKELARLAEDLKLEGIAYANGAGSMPGGSCPQCTGVQLQEFALGAAQALSCHSCGGAFFKKGVVADHAPQLISPAQEAPVVQLLAGVLGSAALLGDPLPLIVALAFNGKHGKTAL